jgi:hypothetical protein
MFRNIFKKEEEPVKDKSLLYIYSGRENRVVKKALKKFNKKEIEIESANIYELRKQFNLERIDAIKNISSAIRNILKDK